MRRRLASGRARARGKAAGSIVMAARVEGSATIGQNGDEQEQLEKVGAVRVPLEKVGAVRVRTVVRPSGKVLNRRGRRGSTELRTAGGVGAGAGHGVGAGDLSVMLASLEVLAGGDHGVVKVVADSNLGGGLGGVGEVGDGVRRCRIDGVGVGLILLLLPAPDGVSGVLEL